MKKVLWFLPPLLALPLLLTSTVSCGCEPNPFSIAGQMQIFPPNGKSPVSALENADLGQKAFIGRQLTQLPLLSLPRDSQCKPIALTELRCEFWNEIGFLYSRGRDVTIRADGSGKVVSVFVAEVFALGSRDQQI